jgi:hypothetical protein
MLIIILYPYTGLRPPKTSNFLYSNAVKGELIASKLFKQDMYGCNSSILIDKKILRNPFKRTVPYPLSCPDLSNLMNYCGSELFTVDHSIPWANNTGVL